MYKMICATAPGAPTKFLSNSLGAGSDAESLGWWLNWSRRTRAPQCTPEHPGTHSDFSKTHHPGWGVYRSLPEAPLFGNSRECGPQTHTLSTATRTALAFCCLTQVLLSTSYGPSGERTLLKVFSIASWPQSTRMPVTSRDLWTSTSTPNTSPPKGSAPRSQTTGQQAALNPGGDKCTERMWGLLRSPNINSAR